MAFPAGAKAEQRTFLALPPSHEMGSSRSSASLNLPGSVTMDFSSSSTPSLSDGGLETIGRGFDGGLLTSVRSPVPRPLFTNLMDHPNFRVLGRYGNREVAGVSISFGNLGSGRTVLWAPRLDQPLATVPSPDPDKEKRRLGFLRVSLREYGLEVLGSPILRSSHSDIFRWGSPNFRHNPLQTLRRFHTRAEREAEGSERYFRCSPSLRRLDGSPGTGRGDITTQARHRTGE